MGAVILLAGGNGSRMGSSVPKQHIKIFSHEIIEYTIMAFSASSLVDYIAIVSNKDYMEEVERVSRSFPKVKKIIQGGQTRIHSVYNAINELQTVINDEEKILISDAARPCIRVSEIENVFDSLNTYSVVTTGVEVYETVLRTEHNKICDIIQRSGVYRQTSPEGYIFKVLKKLYLNKPMEIISSYNNIGIDQLFDLHEEIGIVKSSPLNFKITTEEDLMIFRSIIEKGFKDYIYS